MAFTVFKVQKASGFAHFASVEREGAGACRGVYFDGRPQASTWNPPALYVPYPESRHWDVSLVFGPSALVLTESAFGRLREFLKAPCYEILPLEVAGRLFVVVNVLAVHDCLNREASKFRDTGTIEQYAFYPSRIIHSIFKIPEEAKGGIFVAEDVRRPHWSFKWQCEHLGLRGLKWKLIWEGDEWGNSVTPPTTELEPSQRPAAPRSLELVSAGPSAVVLRWPKVEGVDLYLIDWRKEGGEFWPVDEFDCAESAVAADESGQAYCVYTDTLPTSGRTFYRVRSFVLDAQEGEKDTSEPTACVEVNLDRGDGDIE